MGAISFYAVMACIHEIEQYHMGPKFLHVLVADVVIYHGMAGAASLSHI